MSMKLSVLATSCAAAAGALLLAPSNASAQYYGPPPPMMVPVQPVDGPRVRFGFEVFAGPLLALGADSVGGAGGGAARIGVQIDHLWGVYYQNSAWFGGLVAGNQNVAAGAILATDMNSILGSVTLGHFFEIALGPSIDVFALAGCSTSATDTYCGSGTQAAFGIHSRLAFQLGTFRPRGPRRTGFSVGVEPHVMFVSPWPIMPIMITLGADWF